MAKIPPLQDKLVTVFGGGGFLGNYVTQALLTRGARVRIASRNPEKGWPLKPLANLGQLQLARCDITNEQNIAAAVAGADAVVNLVGDFDGDLMKLMGDAAGSMAKLAQQAGAHAFVQTSALAADPDSTVLYARSKAQGEKLVREAFPKATIVRPSIIFGEDDNFINMFARTIKYMRVLPVFGPDAKLQLVYVDDVAEAIAQSLENPASHGGKVYELGGPEALTMMDINERIAQAQERKRSFIPMSDSASRTFASLPGTPMSRDQWIMLKSGSVPSDGSHGFKAFGIQPKPLGLFLDKWMVCYRKHGRFTGTHALTN